MKMIGKGYILVKIWLKITENVLQTRQVYDIIQLKTESYIKRQIIIQIINGR